MDVALTMWIYRLTTLYLSLWPQKPTELSRGRSEKTQNPGETNFTASVDRCLDRFQTLRTYVEPAFNHGRTKTVYLLIYRQTYCKFYEESLQCLHELLLRNQSNRATEIVQQRLGQPWALRTNLLCDINVKQTPTPPIGQRFTTLPSSGETVTDTVSERTEKDKTENLKFQRNSDTQETEIPSSSKFTSVLLKHLSKLQRLKVAEQDSTDKTATRQKARDALKQVLISTGKNTARVIGNINDNVQEFDKSSKQEEEKLAPAKKTIKSKTDTLYFKLSSRQS